MNLDDLLVQAMSARPGELDFTNGVHAIPPDFYLPEGHTPIGIDGGHAYTFDPQGEIYVNDISALALTLPAMINAALDLGGELRIDPGLDS